MRIFLTIVLLMGVGLVGAATFLAIDASATDERRAAVQGAIADTATAHENREIRRRSLLGRLASGYQSVKNGIFKSSGLNLPEALPAAPEGWAQQAYHDADGEAITGTTYAPSALASTTTHSILSRFDKAGKGRKMTARATYGDGTHLIAIALHGDMKMIRKAEAGHLKARVQSGKVFARLDGVPVILQPQFDQDAFSGKVTPVAYRHFTLDLDGQVEIELLTDADDAAVLRFLSGLDMAALQAALPVKSHGFAAGTGLAVPAATKDG